MKVSLLTRVTTSGRILVSSISRKISDQPIQKGQRMLALKTHDGETVAVIIPSELVSVTALDTGKYRLLVETIGDILYHCDWLSPADEEPIQL